MDRLPPGGSTSSWLPVLLPPLSWTSFAAGSRFPGRSAVVGGHFIGPVERWPEGAVLMAGGEVGTRVCREGVARSRVAGEEIAGRRYTRHIRTLAEIWQGGFGG